MSFSSAKILLTGSLLFTLNACSSDSTKATPENQVSFSDFEALDGWAPGLPVTTEKAHSGRFSAKVDKGAEFSIGYANLLGKVSPTKINKLNVSGWVLRAGLPAKAFLVVEITNPANPAEKVLWEALDIHEQVKTYNTWTKVSKDFTIPATVQPTYQLKVYMWQAGATQPTYLDDVEITKS